jgi:hypothetical protein
MQAHHRSKFLSAPACSPIHNKRTGAKPARFAPVDLDIQGRCYFASGSVPSAPYRAAVVRGASSTFFCSAIALSATA